MPPRAVFTLIAAPLADTWGLKVATEKFGTELIEAMPRHSKGRNAGKLRGYLCFVKCASGGWATDVPIPGFPVSGGVIYPGTSDWRLTLRAHDEDPRGHSTVATWIRGSQGASVQRVQSPADAEALFKAYGKEPRY
jgi:hypothetical protein